MEYLILIAIFSAIYAILGISLNLVVGYTGLLSITQAAFFGIGAYATALLLTHGVAGFFLSVLIGIIISCAVSFIIGVVLSKFDGDYYALGSFGFNIIVFSIFLNWQSVTRGPLGVSGISRPALRFMNYELSLSSDFLFLILASSFLILVYFISRFIVNSSFGRVLKAIREDEKAIQIFGYHTLYFKLAIFVISA